MRINKFQYLVIFNGLLALFIIVWGAWVRLSGSGAGCGEHWPLCNGEIVPLRPSFQTLTEWTHRFTTGLFGLSVVAQVLCAWKTFGPKDPATKGSLALLFFTLIESLIGAVLVKKGLVGNNTSSLRAVVVGFHLINTLFLMGTFPYTWLNGQGQKKFDFFSFKDKGLPWLGLGLFIFLSAFGAITALGNTLFPSDSLIQGMKADFSLHSPFLIQLRFYHPVMAIMTGLFWIILLHRWGEEEKKELYHWVSYGFYFSLAFGVINWLLMAPVWGALFHLFLADLLWLGILSCFLVRSPQRVD